MRAFLTIFAALAITATAAENVTALGALKLLPKEQQNHVARIEARDGNPAPERWYLLVHDPTAEQGVREIVVASGAIVTTRTLSQFVDQLTADEVLGDTLKFDSDRAAKLAQQFAQANKATLGSVNYELRKDGAESVPLWRLTCFDNEGLILGSLTLTATKGAVISHQGFAIQPGREIKEAKEPPPVKRERFQTSSDSQVTRERPMEVRRATTPLPPPPRRNLLERVFGGDRD